MRSRLLMSAAILVAGVALASAQNAPGGTSQNHQHDRHQAGNHDRSGIRNDGRNPAHTRKDRGPDALGLEYLGLGDSGAGDRGGENPRWIRHATSTRRSGVTSDRPVQDHAAGQGRHPATLRLSRESGPQERDTQDFAQAWTDRGLPDQSMGSASERESRHARSATRKQATSHVRIQAHKQARNRAHARDNQASAQARSAAVSHPDSQQGGRDDIRKVQAALNQQGFKVGDPDGKLGKRTKVALIAFQKQHHLRTTGKVDRATLDALLPGGGTTAPPPVSGPADDNQPNPAQALPGQAQPDQTPPTEAAPQGLPAKPDTTGQGAPPTALPPVEEPPPAAAPGGNMNMPEGGGTGRVPSGSPQDEHKEGTTPDDDQR